MRNKAQRGYTLIEILIVVFIISIVTSVALLSIGRNENKRLESFANDFAQVLTLAQEQAMLQPAVLGLTLNDHSFGFAALDSSTDKKNWIPLTEKILGKHTIPSDMEVKIKMAEEKSATTEHDPQIIISTNGDMTPFTIYVGKPGEKPRYVIIGEADGSIQSKPIS